MKYFILLLSSLALAAGETNITDDVLKFGKSSSSADKELIANIGNGGANPRLRVNPVSSKWQFSNDGAVFNDFGAGGGGSAGVNMLINSDFENASTTGWTTGGSVTTFAVTNTASNVAFDVWALEFDPTDGTGALFGNIEGGAVPTGLQGKDCLARGFFKTTESGYVIQVIDGGFNVLASVTLGATTGYEAFNLPYVCPTSGESRFRINKPTGSPAPIFLDNMHIGENFLLGNVQNAEIIGTLVYNGATNCLWVQNAASFTDFPADADCNSTTVTGDALAPTTEIPGIRFNSIAPGDYVVTVQGTFNQGGNAVCGYRVSDGVTSGPSVGLGAGDMSFLTGVFSYSAQQTSKTFRIQGARDSGTGDCNIANQLPLVDDLLFIVKRIPAPNERAIRVDQLGWKVDVSMFGATAANVDLGASAQSSYVSISNANLQIETNPGSIPANIACVGATGVGDTCDGVPADEVIGIQFVAPIAGEVLACVDFTHQASMTTGAGTGDVQPAFQLVQVDPADPTSDILEGKSKVSRRVLLPQDGSANITNGVPIHLCGIFNFPSSGTKSIVLKFEQTSAVNAATNILIFDRSAAIGQRDMRWTVYPLRQFIVQPLIVNSVATTSPGSVHLVSALITNSGTPTISSQNGSWISSLVDNGVGDTTINIAAGVFAAAPVCRVGLEDSAGFAFVTGAISTTQIPNVITQNTTPTNIDDDFTIVCVGERLL